MKRRVLLSLVPPALVLITAAALAWQRSRVPARSDWRAATDHIRAHLQPGDGVTWMPISAGEGRLFFHGLPAFQLTNPRAPDLARYQRVWVLGAFGRSAGDWGMPASETLEFGPLTLERVPVTGERVVGDLRAVLDTARVRRLTRDGATTPCDFWDGQAWHCGVQRDHAAVRACLAQDTKTRFRRRRSDPWCGLTEWFRGPGRYRVSKGHQPIGRDMRVIDGEPRACIWFNPPPRQGRLQLDWAQAPAGDLVIDFGFTDHVITDHNWSGTRTQPATLRVLRGDTVVAEREAAPVRGWFRLRQPLSGAGPLRFEVEGQSDVDAHFCFDATVRRQP